MPDEAVFGLHENPGQIVARQGLKLDADRESALQFRDQIRRFHRRERSRRDEQHVVRAHGAVLGLNGRPLDDGQKVALDAFPAHIRPGSAASARDNLVDLVEEDDSLFLRDFERFPRHGVHVDEFLGLFRPDNPTRVGDGDPSFLRLFRKQVSEHFVDVDPHRVHPGAAKHGNRHTGGLRYFDLHFPVIQLSRAKQGKKLLPGAFPQTFVLFRRLRLGGFLFSAREGPEKFGDARLFLRTREEDIHDALLRPFRRGILDLLDPALLDHRDGGVRQFPNDGFDVAPDVPDFSELRRLDLHKGRVHEIGKPPGYFRLSDARRAYHQNVFRHDLPRDLGGKGATAHSVPESDRDGALRAALTDDIPVEVRHDLPRRQPVGSLFERRHSPIASTEMTLSV